MLRKISMFEVFLDALLDTLKVLPFLLIIYIVIELIEHKTSLTGNKKILQGRLAPLLGSAAGLIPLCGFSVMSAKLYERGYIRTGTVLAVFIATSDEAIILLAADLTDFYALSAILPLLAVKFILAVGAGYLANAVLYKEKLTEPEPATHAVDYTCAHEHEEPSNLEIYLLSPVWHTLKIGLYLLVVNYIFGILIYAVGEETIASSLATDVYLQPVITAAVGLIPSCASSVILTSAYVKKIITFGSLVSGLVVNAGMGFVILMKNPKTLKRTLLLLAAAFAISCAAGILINVIASFINL